MGSGGDQRTLLQCTTIGINQAFASPGDVIRHLCASVSPIVKVEDTG